MSVPTPSPSDAPVSPGERPLGLATIPCMSNFGNVYAATVQTRNTEASVYWNRFSILGALVLGFTAAGLAARSDSAFVAHWRWACGAGMALSLLWLFVALTGRALVEYWNDRVVALESDDVRTDWRAFSHLKNSPRRDFYRDRIRAVIHLVTQPYTYLALSLPLLAAVGWLFLLLSTPPFRNEIVELQKEVDRLSRELVAVDRVVSVRIQTLETDFREHARITPTRAEFAALQRKIEVLSGPTLKKHLPSD